MNYHNTGKLLIGAQDDENRVKYGDGLIKEYSERFTKELGNRYSVTTLKYMRMFYLLIEKGQPLADQLTWFYYCELLFIKYNINYKPMLFVDNHILPSNHFESLNIYLKYLFHMKYQTTDHSLVALRDYL